MSRPQDKNLIPLTERSEEEAHAIRSAGGKASQEKRRERQMMADLLELYSGLPITDKRKQNRLKKLGIPSEVLTQKMLGGRRSYAVGAGGQHLCDPALYGHHRRNRLGRQRKGQQSA